MIRPFRYACIPIFAFSLVRCHFMAPRLETPKNLFFLSHPHPHQPPVLSLVGFPDLQSLPLSVRASFQFVASPGDSMSATGLSRPTGCRCILTSLAFALIPISPFAPGLFLGVFYAFGDYHSTRMIRNMCLCLVVWPGCKTSWSSCRRLWFLSRSNLGSCGLALLWSVPLEIVLPRAWWSSVLRRGLTSWPIDADVRIRPFFAQGIDRVSAKPTRLSIR